MKTHIKSFSQLSVHELYDILELRSRVFVMDQQCIYLDPDGLDKDAIHFFIEQDGTILAYARIMHYPENHVIKFGRVLTHKEHRGLGLGKVLVADVLRYIHQTYPGYTIRINAQYYLEKFYHDFGFTTDGLPYELEGIPHIYMSLQP